MISFIDYIKAWVEVMEIPSSYFSWICINGNYVKKNN